MPKITYRPLISKIIADNKGQDIKKALHDNTPSMGLKIWFREVREELKKNKKRKK